MEKLPRLAQPEALVGPRFRLGDEDVGRELDEVRLPAGPPSLRLAPGVGLERIPVRVAVVVEGRAPARGDDVVARVAIAGLDLDRPEAVVGISFDHGVRQDVAGTAGEEHTVRQGPAAAEVALRHFARHIHANVPMIPSGPRSYRLDAPTRGLRKAG